MKSKARFRQFSGNLIALSTGTVQQTLIQIVSIPIFLSVFRTERYAEWLIAFNIAQFTMLLDFGTITSSQNSFKFLNANGQKDIIYKRVKQISNLILLTFFGYIVLLILVHEIYQLSFYLSLTAIFILSNLLQSYFGLLESLTRMDSRTSLGIYLSNMLRIVEFIGICLGLFLYSQSLIAVALCGLFLKSICFILTALRLRERYHFIEIERIDLTRMVQNLREGAPFLLLKSSEWMLISGTVILIHGHISAGDLILFVTSRTFFRLGFQLTTLVTFAYGYEMTNCWASKDYPGFLLTIQRCVRVSALLSTVGFLSYWTIGSKIFSFWTDSRFVLSREVLIWGVFYSLFLSINQNQKTKFNAINANLLVSVAQILISAALVSYIFIQNNIFSVVEMFIMITLTEMLSYSVIRILMRGKIRKTMLDLSEKNITSK